MLKQVCRFHLLVSTAKYFQKLNSIKERTKQKKSWYALKRVLCVRVHLRVLPVWTSTLTYVYSTDEVNVTPCKRGKKRNIRMCAVFTLSVWVLLRVFRGHIPGQGVGILSSAVSHTELTGGPLFLLQAAGDPDSAQWPLRDHPAFFYRPTPLEHLTFRGPRTDHFSINLNTCVSPHVNL